MAVKLPVIFLLIAIIFNACSDQTPTVDLAIQGGYILTANENHQNIQDGLILIKQGKITYIGTIKDGPEYVPAERFDAEGMIICPGWVNAHTHAAMTLFRGMADDLPLEEWLTQKIWPAERMFLTAHHSRLGAELAILEQLSHGVTTFADMYFFEDELAELADSLGIRVMIGEGITSFQVPSADSIQESFHLVKQQVERWSGSPFVFVSVAPHSPYAVNEKDLLQCDSLSRALDIPLQIHVSETRHEVEQSVGTFGKSPVRRLAELGLLREGTIIAHCVHPDAEDIRLLRNSRSGIVHCPQSNLKLGSGIAPVAELLTAGVRVAAGTDGAASNNDLDLKAELLTGALLQKGILEDPAILSADDWFRIGNIEGARVLGMDHLIGSLETGKYADLLIYRTDGLSATPMYDPVSHLLYTLDEGDLEAVMIQGNWKMKAGQLMIGTPELVRQKVDNLARKMQDSLVSMYQ